MGYKDMHFARLAVSAGLVAALGGMAVAPVVAVADDVAPQQIASNEDGAQRTQLRATQPAQEQKAASVRFADGTAAEYATLADAAKALQSGATLTLLDDFSTSGFGIKVTVPDVTIDLNGHSMTSSKETANQTYGYLLKIDSKAAGRLVIKNGASGQSVLSGRYYQIIADGPASGALDVVLEGDIAFNSTFGESWQKGLLLKDGARIEDSDAARTFVCNGGFLTEDPDGKSYIYGDPTHALKNATSGTSVYMLSDYVTASPIASGSVGGVLDCMGKTITYTGTGQYINVNHDNVSLTVQNAEFTTPSTLLKQGGAAILHNGSSLTLDSVTMSVPGDTYGIVTNGTNSNVSVRLIDSRLIVSDGQGVYFPSSGSVEVENSTIDAKHSGIQMCAGTLSIKGKNTKVSVTGDPVAKTENDGGIVDGAAISIVNRGYPGGSPKATIYDGTFSSAASSSAIKAYSFSNADKTEQTWEKASENVSVAGGTFSSTPENFEGLLADGCSANVGDGGSTSVLVPEENGVARIGDRYFTSIQSAFELAESNEEIDLVKDADVSEATEEIVVSAGKTVTFDLNGQTLRASNTGLLSAYGTLIVKDSTDTQENGTGQGKMLAVKPYSQNCASGLIVARSGGSVVLESGLIDAATEFKSDNANQGQFGIVVENKNGDASVVVNGGKIIAGWYAITGNGTNASNNGLIEVNGGELESTADYAIYSPQAGGVKLSGGRVSGACGAVHIQRGSITVSDGSLVSKGVGSTGVWGDGTSGSGNAVIDVNGKYGSVVAKITGGNFASEGDSVLIHKGNPNEGETISVEVTGGTYNKDPKEFVPDGYEVSQSGKTWTVAKKVVPPSGGGGGSTSDKTDVEHNQDGSTTTTVTKPDGSQTITHETATGTESVVKKDFEGNVTSTEVSVSKTDAASGKVELPIEKSEPAADAGKAQAVEVKVPSTVTPDKPVQVTVPVAKAEGAEPNYGIVVYAVDADGNEAVIPKCAVDKDGNVVFEATGDVTIKVVDAARDMPDVTDADWFAGGVVDFATARGIVNGVDTPSGKQFRGYDGTSRGMLVAMLHNLELNPEAASDESLPDVPEGAFYADAAAWALGEGILSGVDMPDGTKQFQGDAPVTREQVAVFLMRYAESLGMDVSARAEIGFPDASEVSAFAKDAMSWAVAEGLFKGDDATGELNPTDGAARAEVAAVLMRFINLMYA